MRKRLATFGDRGRLVRMYVEDRRGLRRYVILWGSKGARRQESFPATREGKLEAEAFFKAFTDEEAKRRRVVREPLTMRQLWDRYREAEFEHLRPNTQRLYADAWRTWEQHATTDAIAEETSIETIHAFRKALDGRGLSTATVQDCIRNVRVVFNWGERTELLLRNRWHLFTLKIAKEKRTQQRPEYRADEFVRLWKALDPDKASQWRPWVAVGLLGIYGNRPNEILKLQWSWIEGDHVRIDPSVVKTGEAGALTLFPLTRSILAVARRWREREGYSGPYVLFPGQSVDQRRAARANPSKLFHYSIQSLTAAIHRAEARAVPAVETIKWRAAHAFRRGLVGDLADVTGDIQLALQAIGDRDLSMAAHYRVKRRDKVDAAIRTRAGQLVPDTPKAPDATRSATETPTESAAEVQEIGAGDSSNVV